MIQYGTTFRHTVASIILVSVLTGSIGASWAEQVLKRPKQGIKVELRTEIDGETATVGQPFEAELTEEVHYKQWTLPTGTDFRGEISEVKQSRHFNRPGYVILQVKEAVLPNGRTFSFDPAQYEPRDKKLRHPEAQTFVESMRTQLPYTLVALAITVPLGATTNVDRAVWIPVGQGIRMVAGSLAGLVRPKYRDEPVPRKLVLGMLDGSGIPRVTGFVGKYPEPEYEAGDTVKLYFNPEGLKDLFQSMSTVSLDTHRKVQREPDVVESD